MPGLLIVAVLAALAVALTWRSPMAFHPADARLAASRSGYGSASPSSTPGVS